MSDLQSIYFTTGQAAAELGVNRLTVRRWVASGRLHGQRVGNVTLIERVGVERVGLERLAARIDHDNQ